MPLTTLFAKSGTAFTPNRAKKGLGKGISEGVLFSRMQMHTFDANYNYNHNYNSTQLNYNSTATPPRALSHPYGAAGGNERK